MERTGRTLLIAGLAGLAVGCQGGPISSRQTRVGGLKASVSQLEYQNEELRNEVDALKAENVKLGDRLLQEKQENEALAKKVDDPDEPRTGSRSGVSDDDEPIPPPKARRTRSSRKPPAASIPGRIEPARDDSDDRASLDDPPPRVRISSRRATLDDRWLPVARGTGSGQGVVK